MPVNVSLSELTSKQVQLIELLLAGVSIVAAAQQVGVAEKTAHKWLKLDHFQQAYKQAQQAIFDETLAELKSGMPDVIKALKRHINADLEPTAASQVKAIQLWAEWVKATADASVDNQEQSSNNLRGFLANCTDEELAIVNPIIHRAASRKQEQEQPGQNTPSIRMVK